MTTTPFEDADRVAFDCTEPLRAALSLDDAPHYSLDAFHAAGKALQTAERVAFLRPEMVELKHFDVASYDRLADVARALRFVQTEILRRVQRAKEVPGLVEEGFKARRQMLSFGESLSYKGAVAPELIIRLRAGSGHLDLVGDLSVLVRELLAQPHELYGPHSPVTMADIQRASAIAHEINVRIGEAAQVDLDQSTLVDERRKLGGLLLRAHGQVRRAVAYLRYDEGDVDTLCPSLYVTGSRKRAVRPEPTTAEDLSAVHDDLHHADENHEPLDPEDNPFAPDED